MQRKENIDNFDSDDTEPFPYHGQPMFETSSPAATSKEEKELQSLKRELNDFRKSPALFEFSDDEPTSPVQLDELRTMWEQVVRFEEASKKLAQAMNKNTASMKRLIDEKEASASTKADNGRGGQKRSTAEAEICPKCGKIKRTRPQPTPHEYFRPLIEAWHKRWMSNEEEN